MKRDETLISDKSNQRASSPTPNFSRKQSKIISSSSSISSSDTDSTRHRKKREKTVARENKDEAIRKEKSEYLYKFNKVNVKGKWSSLKLDMNNTFDEIRNEYERVSNAIQNERSVAFLKRMLLLGVQGVEMMNNKFDPLGVDLDGWSEAMGYSLENQEYDEVMSELYEKYKSRGQMSPEVKLIFMIISSAAMFTVTKKLTNMDSNNALNSFIKNITQSQQPQQQPPQPLQQPSRVYNEKVFKPKTESTVDDPLPPKLRGPTLHFDNNENDETIENIMRTMNARKMEQNESTDEVFKNIELNSQKKGRGRPRKSGISKASRA
jgi:hypothetical protein